MNISSPKPKKTAISWLTLLALIGYSGSAITDNVNVMTNVGCVEDVSGYGGLSCTANDVVITDATAINILDDGCVFAGDTVTFTADYGVETVIERYDIGLWFAVDGDPNGNGARSGTCTAATLAYSPDPPWLDLDSTSNDPNNVIQDTCGDIDGYHTPLEPQITLTVACVDENEDGWLDEVPFCVTWRRLATNELCTAPTQTIPGSAVECRCGVIGLATPIEVPAASQDDADDDGVPDSDDNCPDVPNSSQDDYDADSLGDACDNDDDNDGVADGDDDFPFDPSESSDNDGDGIGDNADPDDDNDGQSDDNEIACGSDPLDAASLSPDTDGDHTPDCIDTDADGDGVNDNVDACPATTEVAPTSSLGLGKNRWARLNGNNFVQAPPQAGSVFSITTTDTRGCSCSQIVDAAGLGENHLSRGCSTSAMLEWINNP